MGFQQFELIARAHDALTAIPVHRARGIDLRQLRIEEHDLLIERAYARVQFAQIILRAARQLHVQLRIFGQAILVLALEGGQLPFQIGDLGPDVLRFRTQKIGASGRLLFARLQILAQVQRGDLVRHCGGHLRRAVLIADRKGDRGFCGAPLARVDHIGADHIEFDVLAHVGDDGFARLGAPIIGVQIVLADDLQEIRRGHDPLADDLDALIGVTADGRAHEVFRHFLLLDQNGAGRAIRGRPEKRGQ